MKKHSRICYVKQFHLNKFHLFKCTFSVPATFNLFFSQDVSPKEECPSSEQAARDLRAKGFGSGFPGSIPRCRSASVAVVAPLVKSSQAVMETSTTISMSTVTRQQQIPSQVINPGSVQLVQNVQRLLPKPSGV